MVPQAFKPVLAFFCVFMAFMLVLKSTWYTNLSMIELVCVTVIGLVYVVLTAFVPNLAAFYRERERIDVGGWKRLGIKVVIYGIIMFLMDRFGEHQPEYILAAAFVLFALNVHFTTHSFGVYEDLGFSQGLIAVAAVALAHLAERGTIKTVFMICGVVLQALYDLFAWWDTPPQEGPPAPPPVQRQEEPNDIVLNVDDGPGDGMPGEEVAGDGMPAEEVAGDGMTDDRVPGDEMAGDGEPGDGMPDDRVPGDEMAGDGEPGDGMPGDGSSDEGRPDEERLAEERLAEERVAAAIRRRIRRRDRITDEMTSNEMADDEISAALKWDAEERQAEEKHAEERNRQDEEIYNADGTLKKKVT